MLNVNYVVAPIVVIAILIYHGKKLRVSERHKCQHIEKEMERDVNPQDQQPVVEENNKMDKQPKDQSDDQSSFYKALVEQATAGMVVI